MATREGEVGSLAPGASFLTPSLPAKVVWWAQAGASSEEGTCSQFSHHNEGARRGGLGRRQYPGFKEVDLKRILFYIILKHILGLAYTDMLVFQENSYRLLEILVVFSL